MNFISSFQQANHNFIPSYKDSFLTFSGEGVFYQLKKSGPEIIYDSAKINFSSTRDEFTYYLNVHSEQNRTRKGVDKENVMNEFLFKVSEKLNLTMYETMRSQDTTSFEWQSDGHTVYGFEFKNNRKDLLAAKTFKELTCKLIYQAKYKSHTSHKTPPLHYLCFCQDREERADFSNKNSKLTMKDNYWNENAIVKSAHKEPVVRLDKMNVENEQPFKKSQESNASEIPIVKPRELNLRQSYSSISFVEDLNKSHLYNSLIEDEFIFSKVGDLFQLDDSYKFIKMQDQAIFAIRYLEETSYQLEIYDGKSILLYLQVLEDDSSYSFDFEGQIFKWVDLQNDVLRVFGFKFHEYPLDFLEKLKEILATTPSVQRSGQRSQAVWETSNKKDKCYSFQGSAVKANLELRYENAFEELASYDEGGFVEEKEEYVETEEVSEFSEEAEEVLKYKKIYTYHAPERSNRYENNVVSQSKMLNRVFVSRGPVVSVFKANETLEFICDLPHLSSLDQSLIHPKKILFYQEDAKMLILNQETDKKIYSLDLERGVITNEWIIDGYSNILDIEHLQKNGELTGNDLFIGINNKNVFQFDPHQQIAPISVKNYASNPKFSCFATTTQGNFAIGSQTGDIRLFKETGKNARNLFAGCGDAIIGIESSKDGGMLVATTENYLMIYLTTIDGVNGYLTSLKKMNPQPIKLSLPMPIIQKYNISSERFSKAKLDNIYEKNEQFVMTTLGRLLIIWRLEDVLQGVNDPKIHEFNSDILDYEFRVDCEDGILVVLESEVHYITV